MGADRSTRPSQPQANRPTTVAFKPQTNRPLPTRLSYIVLNFLHLTRHSRGGLAGPREGAVGTLILERAQGLRQDKQPL